MEEFDDLAKDLLFTMVYHKTLQESDIPHKYITEYEKWAKEYEELNRD